MEKELSQLALAKNSLQFAEADERDEYHKQEQRQSQDCLPSASAQVSDALNNRQ